MAVHFPADGVKVGILSFSFPFSFFLFLSLSFSLCPFPLSLFPFPLFLQKKSEGVINTQQKGPFSEILHQILDMFSAFLEVIPVVFPKILGRTQRDKEINKQRERQRDRWRMVRRGEAEGEEDRFVKKSLERCLWMCLKVLRNVSLFYRFFSFLFLFSLFFLFFFFSFLLFLFSFSSFFVSRLWKSLFLKIFSFTDIPSLRFANLRFRILDFFETTLEEKILPFLKACLDLSLPCCPHPENILKICKNFLESFPKVFFFVVVVEYFV